MSKAKGDDSGAGDAGDAGITARNNRSRVSLGKRKSRPAHTPREAASSMESQRPIPLLMTTTVSLPRGGAGSLASVPAKASDRRFRELLV